MAAPAGTIKHIAAMQNNWRSLLAPDFKAPAATKALKPSDVEWRKQQTPEQFHMLREEGGETPNACFRCC